MLWGLFDSCDLSAACLPYRNRQATHLKRRYSTENIGSGASEESLTHEDVLRWRKWSVHRRTSPAKPPERVGHRSVSASHQP